jgi:hypothetical protein
MCVSQSNAAPGAIAHLDGRSGWGEPAKLAAAVTSDAPRPLPVVVSELGEDRRVYRRAR